MVVCVRVMVVNDCCQWGDDAKNNNNKIGKKNL